MLVKTWVPPQLRTAADGNDEDIRLLQGDSTSVKDTDELAIIPEIGGG